MSTAPTTSFEQMLRGQVQAMPMSFNKRRLLHILSLPDSSWRKQHVLLRAEGEVRSQLGIDDDTDVDWKEGATATSANGAITAINWAQILQMIMQLLPLLIQILGGL